MDLAGFSDLLSIHFYLFCVYCFCLMTQYRQLSVEGKRRPVQTPRGREGMLVTSSGLMVARVSIGGG